MEGINSDISIFSRIRPECVVTYLIYATTQIALYACLYIQTEHQQVRYISWDDGKCR